MKKRVVVIGGGFAGSCCARKLEKRFDVTLIDSKDYFEFTPSVLRTIVEPEHIKKIQILHKDYLKEAKVFVGKVSNIDGKNVYVDKKKIPYDYLVIASGSNYVPPIKEENTVLPQRAEHLKNSYENLSKAKKVLIIGGGLVGVELTAEIASHYGDKGITLIHSHKRLMERNNRKSSIYANRFLKNRGVNIIFGEKVIETKNRFCITDSKKKIEFDIVFVCTGIKPNYEFLEKNFKDKLDERGFVKVNKFFQMKGMKNIFVAGDVCGMKEEKTAQNAEIHGKVISKNIHSLSEGKELEEYKPSKKTMVVSLGKKRGIIENKNFVMTGFIPGKFKSFVEWWEMRKLRNRKS